MERSANDATFRSPWRTILMEHHIGGVGAANLEREAEREKERDRE
jgi:hypothetical protein